MHRIPRKNQKTKIDLLPVFTKGESCPGHALPTDFQLSQKVPQLQSNFRLPSPSAKPRPQGLLSVNVFSVFSQYFPISDCLAPSGSTRAPTRPPHGRHPGRLVERRAAIDPALRHLDSEHFVGWMMKISSSQCGRLPVQ